MDFECQNITILQNIGIQFSAVYDDDNRLIDKISMKSRASN